MYIGEEALFHSVFLYFDLGPLHAASISKYSYLNTGPKLDYGFLIELISECIYQVLRKYKVMCTYIKTSDYIFLFKEVEFQ